MKNISRILMWFIMLSKRLLMNRCFLAIVVVIPLIVPAMGLIAEKDSGVVRIGLCNIQKDGKTAETVAESLMEEESILHYEEYNNEESAGKALENGEVDAVWIFHEDFEERLKKHTAKESIRPVVSIVQREESIRLSLAREKLFGKLYPSIVYGLYENFVMDEIASDGEVTNEQLKKTYEKNEMPSELIEIYMQGSEKSIPVEAEYLTAPLRGLMSLFVVLCTLIASGVFMVEKRNGIYARISLQKHFIPAFGSCLAAAVISGVAVLISFCFGEISLGILREIIMMLAYVWAVAAMGTLIGVIFRRFELFGALIPFVMLGMLVLCPVFFSIKVFPALRFMMPPYYYLMSVLNPEYIIYMLLFGSVALIGASLVCTFRK